MKTSTIIRFFAALLVPLLSACTYLHREPDGAGEDPTEVLINADINIKLHLPQQDENVPTRAEGAEYLHRFVIEAVAEDGRVHDRQTFFAPVENDVNTVIQPVSMRLHARNYRLLVWSDYVRVIDGDTTTYYDPESLCPVLPARSFTANNEYKDAFQACHPLDLRKYADKWQERIDVDIELQRPVARYELITVDVEAFRNKLKANNIAGKSFKARIRYAGYIATGFNVAEQTPKNMLNFLSYDTSLATVTTTKDKELRIGFDYVICPVEATEMVLGIEIVNELNEVVSGSSARFPIQAGYNTRVKGRFLTSSTGGGVGIDPGYDGVIEIDLGKL